MDYLSLGTLFMDFNEPAITIILLLILFIGFPTNATAATPNLLAENLQENGAVSEEKLCGGDDDDVRVRVRVIVGCDDVIESASQPLNIVPIDPVYVVPSGWESIEANPADVVYAPSGIGNQVEELFDRAWESGTRTYSGLIEYVRVATGKGTSKTRVKSWKEKRGLLDE